MLKSSWNSGNTWLACLDVWTWLWCVDSCANKGWASSKLDWVHLLLLFLSTLTMKSTITQEERLVKGMFDFFLFSSLSLLMMPFLFSDGGVVGCVLVEGRKLLMMWEMKDSWVGKERDFYSDVLPGFLNLSMEYFVSIYTLSPLAWNLLMGSWTKMLHQKNCHQWVWFVVEFVGNKIIDGFIDEKNA